MDNAEVGLDHLGTSDVVGGMKVNEGSFHVEVDRLNWVLVDERYGDDDDDAKLIIDVVVVVSQGSLTIVDETAYADATAGQIL